MHLDSHLDEHGEGLMGVAFGTPDVKASYAEATSHGIDTGELRSLRRNFEHPEGWTQPSFELFSPDPGDIEGLMHVVVIQHLTPELIRRPDFLEHANGCIGISEMSGSVLDAPRCAARMRRLLGADAVTESDDGVVLTVPSGQSIRLDQSDSAGLSALTLRVRDIESVAALFDATDVAFVRDDQGMIVVAPEFACGTTLKFAGTA
jgi:hypothetical protein